MAKQPKQTQTDYTRGGKAISDTSIPLYQSGLTTLSDYTLNPDKYIQSNLDKYYTNTSKEGDFLTDYNRAMGNATSNMYAATHGGYSSAGQRAYDDTQRYENDLAARLRDAGVMSAYNMYTGNVGNLNAALNQYNAAYGLGKPYSDVEQYNYMVDQYNSPLNQIASAAGGVGKVLSAIPTPWTQAIGAGLQGFGNVASLDTSALSSGAARTQGAGTTGGQYGGGGWNNFATSVGGGLSATAEKGGNNWITAIYGGNQKLPMVTGIDSAGRKTVTAQGLPTLRG